MSTRKESRRTLLDPWRLCAERGDGNENYWTAGVPGSLCGSIRTPSLCVSEIPALSFMQMPLGMQNTP